VSRRPLQDDGKGCGFLPLSYYEKTPVDNLFVIRKKSL